MVMEKQELAPLPERLDPPGTLLETVMRAAADPTIDPARLHEFLKIGRELEQDRAKAAFNADFARMKPHLPVIDKRGVVVNKSGRVQFRYPRYDDVHEAVTPVLTKFNFATSYNFEEPGEGKLTVILEVAHTAGYSKFFRWTLPGAGENQFVNNLQNASAAKTFGKRNILIDALDILCKEIDRDGMPQAAPERITEEQAREIEDMLASCEDRRKGTSARFAKWLKTEFQIERIRDLLQGAQHQAVQETLRERMEALGVK